MAAAKDCRRREGRKSCGRRKDEKDPRDGKDKWDGDARGVSSLGAGNYDERKRLEASSTVGAERCSASFRLCAGGLGTANNDQ